MSGREYDALLDVAEAARDFQWQALARFIDPQAPVADRLTEKLAVLDAVRYQLGSSDEPTL